jgi:hypothetical protein
MGIEAMKERIDEMMEARQKLWIAACEADGIDPAASFKALKAARARRLRRAAAESLGLRAVRGAVTGATYYE